MSYTSFDEIASAYERSLDVSFDMYYGRQDSHLSPAEAREIEQKQLATAVTNLDDMFCAASHLDKEQACSHINSILFDLGLSADIGYVFADKLTIEAAPESTIVKHAIQDPLYRAEQKLWFVMNEFFSEPDSNLHSFFIPALQLLAEKRIPFSKEITQLQQELDEQVKLADHPGFTNVDDAALAIAQQLTSNAPLHGKVIKKAIQRLADYYDAQLDDRNVHVELVRA